MVDPATGAGDHLLDPAKIHQPAHRFFPGDVEKQMVGVILDQVVIQDVR